MVQSSHSSYHTTDGSHDQTVILSETSTWSMVISGCARGGLRSGGGVGFDSASTMLGQPKNGDARRKSGSSSKLRPLRRPHSNDRQHSFDSIPLPFANALSDCLRTWTGTRPALGQERRVEEPHSANARDTRSFVRECAKSEEKSFCRTL